jgi:tetratricopeptide (TPR) repeat protein
LEHFHEAEMAVGWNEADGKEVLSLFEGNAALKQGNLAEAQTSYDRALARNPDYSRARLGAAEVLFHASRGSCEAGGVDPAGLRRSLDGFRSALTAAVQPPLADVPTKAAFGEARVQLCMSQALVGDHWQAAERGFRQVLDEFATGNERVRQMAAESHAGLGFLELPSASDADKVERYRKSAAEYEKAADLTRLDDRKAFFSSMLGFVYGQLGEPARADAAYEQAIRLAPDPATRGQYEIARQELRERP